MDQLISNKHSTSKHYITHRKKIMQQNHRYIAASKAGLLRISAGKGVFAELVLMNLYV